MRESYLDGLTDLFGIMVDSTSSDSRISQIFGGMQKWYRALPQVTTNVKNNQEYFNETFYKKALSKISSILQRYEVNPYEALFEQIPMALAVDKDLEKCLERLSKFKKKLQGYYSWVFDRTIEVTKNVFGKPEDSLYHILNDWYKKQSDMAKGTIDEHSISAFMKTISLTENSIVSSDQDIIDSVVKAITGVHIDYWNDTSLEQYSHQICELKAKIEAIKDTNEDIDKTDSKAV